MKKIYAYIVILFIFFIAFGCSKKITSDNIVLFSQDFDYTKTQFDSICIVENIPQDLSKWYQMSFVDAETKEPIRQYMLVLGNDTITGTIYKIIIENIDGENVIYKYNKMIFKNE